MNGLLQKDAPWIAAFAVGGAVALALVAASHGFLHLFVVTPGKMEELFFTAASLGLFVGAFAGVWDDLLGTREFLQHRPVSAAKLARAPIASVGLVLLAWFVLTPLLAWVFASLWSGVFLPTHWAGVTEIVAGVGVAVPCAAVGLAAAALPSPWWLRIVFGAVCAVVVGVAISNAPGRDYSDASSYAFVCVLAAIVMFALAVHAGTVRRDADRPWPPSTRWRCGGVFVASLGLLVSVGAFEAQRGAIAMLHDAYPDLAVLDGQVVRFRRGDDWRLRQLVDAEHAAIGALRSREGFADLPRRAPHVAQVFSVDAPRWHWRSRTLHDWRQNRELLLGAGGRAWLWWRDAGRVERLTRDGGAAFPDGCDLDAVQDTDDGSSVMLIADADSGAIWRLDDGEGRFVSHDLPDGDRFVRFRTFHQRDVDASSSLAVLREMLAGIERDDLAYVRGERGDYAMRAGRWVAIELPATKPRHATSYDGLQCVARDPIHYVVEVAASDERAAFRHEFTPRTASEHLHAAHACLWSLLRAPALQVVGFLRGHAPAGERQRTTIFDDPLLRGRSRPWLLALCVAIAALSVWTVRRRMRALSADAATQRFWILAAAATGVAGVLACGLCTRRRMFARPAVVPAPEPRIRSVSEPEEVLS